MFATIFIPNFYLQAALRHQAISPATPVAVINENDKKPVIIQLNSAAEAAGVDNGMTPSQGLARCLSLLIKTRSPSQEKSIQEVVLHYAFSLSPYVEATGPGICTVEFMERQAPPSGQHPPEQVGRLFSKVSRVIDQLAACEIIAQAGLSPTPDTSFLAAHLARPVLEIEDPKKFLAPLPIDTLAIPLQS
jgi:nucleotidyltransferase/DNA polymerase involved in DNA repair